MLADVFALLVSLCVIVFAVSQVILPLAKGTPLFPSFSGRERRLRELQQELEDLKAKTKELELEKQLDLERNRTLQAELDAISALAVTPTLSSTSKDVTGHRGTRQNAARKSDLQRGGFFDSLWS